MGTLSYEKVYEAIKEKIKGGVWKPGDQIPTIPQLSKETGVGISSVREAIRILAKQGILKIEQGRGTYVLQDFEGDDPSSRLDFLEKATMKQLTEARLVIEPELAALAAKNASASDVVEIKEAAEEMQLKVKRNQDFFHEDIKFHYKIAVSANNIILQQMLETMSDLLADSRRMTMKVKKMNDKAAYYHMLIAEAIEDRNPIQARNLMHSHISDILNDMEKKEFFKRDKEKEIQ
ncbi:FadR/GntR family transcriptional regulator [Evansella sp. AB-rgal1]|uniref:FadR/GntR family transcriptional regulator n=1 Tax=Evansella sp. AB-rgal1 TaxID=3242696 RepID=UPI00359F107F